MQVTLAWQVDTLYTVRVVYIQPGATAWPGAGAEGLKEQSSVD